MEEDPDLKDVMRAERSRGSRRPLDLLSELEVRQLRQMVRDLLRPETTEQDVRDYVRALGIPDERLEAVLRVWRAEKKL